MKEKKAVALKYERGKVPVVSAKGRGFIAEKIVEIAREHGIEVVENSDLVETLISIDIGSEIPPKVYRVVAEILAFVYRITHRGTPQA